jgi:ankyrin repeat protein
MAGKSRAASGTAICCLVLSLFFIVGLSISGCKGREGIPGPGQGTDGKRVIYSDKAFFDAVKSGNKETVAMAIKEGFNVNTKDKDGYTALLIAAEKGDFEMAHLLVEKGADVNAKDKDGYTALMYVAYAGNLEIAKILIKNGADVNVRDKDGWTALMFSRVGKKTDITELLKKSGAGK